MYDVPQGNADSTFRRLPGKGAFSNHEVQRSPSSCSFLFPSSTNLRHPPSMAQATRSKKRAASAKSPATQDANVSASKGAKRRRIDFEPRAEVSQPPRSQTGLPPEIWDQIITDLDTVDRASLGLANFTLHEHIGRATLLKLSKTIQPYLTLTIPIPAVAVVSAQVFVYRVSYISPRRNAGIS
jgi:hypothetical protein